MSEQPSLVHQRLDDGLTENDHLFGTSMTLNMLERILQQIFKTSSTFGPCISAERIGINQGSLSIMMRIRFHWQRAVDDTLLPESLVIKLPTTARYIANANLDVWETILKMVHPNEVTFYELIEKADDIDLRIPKCYGAQDFGRNGLPGFFVFEDLCDIGAIKSIYKGLSIDALKMVMESLAALHAFSLKNVDPQNYPRLRSSFFKIYNEDIQLGKKQLLKDIDILSTVNAEYFGTLLNRLRESIENNPHPYSAIQIHKGMNIPLVLTHGDLYSLNIMWKKTGNGNKTSDTLVAIVDYQNAHLGSIGEDFAYLFGTSVSPQIRRAHFDELIEHYHSSLTAKLGGEAPFTSAQIKIAYWRFMPFAFVMLVPLWRSFSSEKKCHLLCKRNPEQMRQNMLERCKCAVEDWYKSLDETTGGQ